MKSTSKYSSDKFFNYCKNGNMEAIFYCIVEEGINPELTNV